MSRIAVIFPGIGYHKDKPLLYYSAHLAREAGYRVECVDFSGIAWERGDLRDPESMKRLFAQAMDLADKSLSGIPEELRGGISQKSVEAGTGDDNRILFVSKSIGTAVAACYAEKNGIDAAQVYLSPIVPFGEFAAEHGLAFYGDNDPLADHEKIEAICAQKKIEAHRIAGGNHSLETGDAEADLKILSEIMGRIKAFIG